MATSTVYTAGIHTKSDETCLDIYYLIWLDGIEKATDIRSAQPKLQSIINRLETFQDVAECQKFIEERSEKAEQLS